MIQSATEPYKSKKQWPGTNIMAAGFGMILIYFVFSYIALTKAWFPEWLDNVIWPLGIMAGALLILIGFVVNGVWAVVRMKHSLRKTLLWTLAGLVWFWLAEQNKDIPDLSLCLLIFAISGLGAHLVVNTKNRFSRHVSESGVKGQQQEAKQKPSGQN
jgi:hypothetical protein